MKLALDRAEKSGRRLKRDHKRLRALDRKIALLSETVAEDLEEAELSWKRCEPSNPSAALVLQLYTCCRRLLYEIVHELRSVFQPVF